MADAKAMAERLMAWLRGHPACAWPVASTVVMGLHGVTDAACSPKSATKVWAAMVRRVREWCTAVEPFRTEGVQFSAASSPATTRHLPPAVDLRKMAVFLRYLDPIMQGDSGAVQLHRLRRRHYPAGGRHR